MAEGDAPPPPPPPPPVVTDADIWNPGGDAGALRTAADAWDAMAGTLRAEAGAVRTSHGAIGEQWSGDARDGYDTHLTDVLTSMDEGAEGFAEVATELRRVADEIESINDQIHQIYIALAATLVVSVAASFVTFGASAAAGAAAAASGAARAASLVRTLSAVVSLSRLTFHGFRAYRFVTVWKQFAVGVGVGVLATAGTKAAFQGQNPFDLENWTVTDLRNIIVGGAGAGIVGAPFIGYGLGVRGNIALGAVSGAAPGVLTDALDGVDPLTATRNAVVNAAFGGAGGYAGFRYANRPRPVTPAPFRGPGGGVLLDPPSGPFPPVTSGPVILDGPPAGVRPTVPGGGVLLDGPPAGVHPPVPGGAVILDGPPAGVRPPVPGGAVILDGPPAGVTPSRPDGAVLLDPPPPVVVNGQPLGPGETLLPSGVILPSGVDVPPPPSGLDADVWVTTGITGGGTPANGAISAAAGNPSSPPAEPVFPEAPVTPPIPGLEPAGASPPAIAAPPQGLDPTPGPITGDSSAPVAPMVVGPEAVGSTAVVQPGESLVDLAERVLGDVHRWDELVAANPGIHPEVGLVEGQVVRLPSPELAGAR